MNPHQMDNVVTTIKRYNNQGLYRLKTHIRIQHVFNFSGKLLIKAGSPNQQALDETLCKQTLTQTRAHAFPNHQLLAGNDLCNKHDLMCAPLKWA